jgi:hypothetical protein
MLGDLPVTEGIAAGAIGFLMQPSPEAGSISAQIQAQMNKLPSLGNKAVTAGLVVHYGNKFTLRNRWLKLGAKALLIGGMFSLGRGKFAQSQALLGEGEGGDWENAMDADEVSGVIDIE